MIDDEKIKSIYTKQELRNGIVELSPEFKGSLIDAVEDFLEEKGVKIENPEKTDSDNPAIIYGSDYDLLASALQEVITSWLPPTPSRSEAEQMVKDLPSELIDAAYAYRKGEYLKEEAERRAEEMGYDYFFDEDDYEELAREFVSRQDGAFNEGAVWEALFEERYRLKGYNDYEE